MRSFFILFLFCNLCYSPLYSQKEIIKNGNKINRLDKKNRKQDRWFFFNREGDVLLSCDYKDDSLISPLTFYSGTDTAFIRFPMLNDMEVFILYLHNMQFIGNYRRHDDTTEIEVVGIYRPVTKDSFEIREEGIGQYAALVKDSAQKWLKTKIYPLYMFGNSTLRDFLYGGFHGSAFIFNKPIYAEIHVDASGVVTKVEFPRDKNNLSMEEEAEITHIFSAMPRWQPYFSDGRIKRVVIPYTWSTKLEKIGSPVD